MSEEKKENNLPEWVARSKEDVAAMHRWVNECLDSESAQLDAENERALNESARSESVRQALLKFFEADGPQLDAAARGNLEPLRDKYPHLAPFLALPKLKRGKHRKPRPKNRTFADAAADVRRIKALWIEFYGRVQRNQDEGPSAIEIAAARWEIAPDDMGAFENYLKKHKAGES